MKLEEVFCNTGMTNLLCPFIGHASCWSVVRYSHLGSDEYRAPLLMPKTR